VAHVSGLLARTVRDFVMPLARRLHAVGFWKQVGCIKAEVTRGGAVLVPFTRDHLAGCRLNLVNRGVRCE
jgi:hypothetical protein